MVSIQMLPLKTKAEDLMKQMEQAIEIVNYVFNEETRDDIMASFKNIKATFVNLESSSSNLDSIVSQSKNKLENILSNVESITKNLESNNKVITHALNNISNISDSLAHANLKQTMIETYQVMSQLNEITEKINNSEGTLGMLLNNETLYYNLEDVTYSLNRLLEDMRLNPKRYVQFSAFNLGKTVYVDRDESRSKKKRENIIYKIMILQSNKSVPLKPESFKGYKNVEEAMLGGSYIYLIGKEKNIENAKLYLKKVSVDFSEAQMVEIREGKYTILINN
jgi:phospholipid/cholesterol/gamma-HCH transport system substrate-binding protein